MSCDSENFYQMVRTWTVRDYWTPGIKAEVILDMLLSEFAASIVKHKLVAQSRADPKDDVILLAKEFPIKRLDDPSNLNAKVDYLIGCPHSGILFLTELKTTSASFDTDQLWRMVYLASQENAVKKLFSDYESIQKTVQDRKADSDFQDVLDLLRKRQNAGSGNKEQKKYRRQLWELVGQTKTDWKRMDENWEEWKQKYRDLKQTYHSIEIAYLSLEAFSEQQKELIHLLSEKVRITICSILDYLPDNDESLNADQKTIWKQFVIPILNSCADAPPVGKIE